MDIAYKREGNVNYAVISGSQQIQETEPNYKIQMLLHNQISRCIPLKIRYMDNVSYLYYEISGRKSLLEYCRIKLMDTECILNFINNLLEFEEQVQNFFLDADNMILEPEMIYISRNRKQFEFCINPYEKKDFAAQLRELLQNMLSWIDYRDKQAVAIMYEIQILAEQGMPSKKQVADIADRIQKQYSTETGWDEKEGEEEIIPPLQENEKYKKPTFWEKLCSKFWLLRKKKNVKQTLEQPVKEFGEVFAEEPETVLLNSTANCYNGIRLIDISHTMPDICIPVQGGIFGKKQDAVDVVIGIPEVSRIHGRIYEVNGAYYVEDFNSSNGTQINGIRLTPYNGNKIESGDILQIGSIQFKVVLPIDKYTEKG